MIVFCLYVMCIGCVFIASFSSYIFRSGVLSLAEVVFLFQKLVASMATATVIRLLITIFYNNFIFSSDWKNPLCKISPNIGIPQTHGTYQILSSVFRWTFHFLIILYLSHCWKFPVLVYYQEFEAIIFVGNTRFFH